MTASLVNEPVTDRVKTYIANRIGPRKYSMWFGQSAVVNYDPATHKLTVATVNHFVADWIEKNFKDVINEAACAELNQTVKIDVQVSKLAPDLNASNPHLSSPHLSSPHLSSPHLSSPHLSSDPNALAPRSSAPLDQSDRPLADTTQAAIAVNQSKLAADKNRVSPAGRRKKKAPFLRYQLQDFVVGQSNQLAFAAASRLADEDNSAAHPLFIHGNCGLGKTHLLQGICQQMAKEINHHKIYYTTGERFTNEFITAVRSNKINQFRKRMRSFDLLAIDDVHFMANKQATQQEFLHSFDEIELGGAKLVLASDCHPKWIKQFSQALISRCIRGMVVKIDAPELDTRKQIISNIARKKGLYLQESLIDTLAQRCCESVREIEGMMNRAAALYSLQGQSPKEKFSERLLEQLFAQGPALSRRPVAFGDITTAVCQYTGVNSEQISGPSRQKHIVTARSLVAFLSRELTSMSYPELAGQMGKKHHSSIVEAVKRIKRQIHSAKKISFTTGQMPIEIAKAIEQIKDQINRLVRQK